ncbi:major facilitator superfamily domain-containing protein [Phaeosphaeriaceae sp. PMI808]|nr:major facilitator superfamily domain-containing protein [Phaeosphaeriaceae sp. PMI808]
MDAVQLNQPQSVLQSRNSAHPIPAPPQDDGKVVTEPPQAFKHSWRVWCIFIVPCLLSFISTIGGQELYVWIANCFLFASTVPQPLYGQIANIFGRKNPILLAIALFALGSALAGSAQNTAMFMAARTIQGLGSAGLYVLSDIIICDLIPPRHCASYLSAVLSMTAIGTTIGPIIGGALAQVEWRRIFRLNLPISGVGLIAIYFLLNVKYTRSPTWVHSPKRVDWLGNAIFFPSMISIFLGLITGGVENPWRTILPIGLGVLGWISFHVHQANPICKEPSTPPRLFRHRTTTVGFVIIFLGAIIMQAIAYFLPIYFQAVRSKSPLTSVSGGVGIIFTATMPSTLAPLPESDIAVATGTYSFIRSFGLVWGVTIASIVFNNEFENHLSRAISVPIRQQFENGAAYSLASGGFLQSLDAVTNTLVIGTYVHALRVVWLVVAAVDCLGFVIVFVEKHVELRTDNETEFGLMDKHQLTIKDLENGVFTSQRTACKA